MFKPISATDAFGPQPFRSLNFLNEQGNHGSANFEPGRHTVFFDGRLFDWYGREVAISPAIEKLVAPFGSMSGSMTERSLDCFIAKDWAGKYSIVTVKYVGEEPVIKFNPSKERFLAYVLNPFPGTCLDVFAKYAAPRIYDAWGLFTTEEGLVFAQTRGVGPKNALGGFIAGSRKEILESPVENGTFHTVNSMRTFMVYQKLMHDVDSGKFSALIKDTISPDRLLRISTDAEVIRHMRTPFGIWWYLDPET